MVRIAVLDQDRCRSKDCGLVCYKYCPKIRSKIEAIRFDKGQEKPTIVENLCSGCGICIKKCPFQAISIVNLPNELEENCSHRFGPNTFKLFRLPTPMPGAVTGLLGKNGIGKTTAFKILSGELKPNLGDYLSPPGWSKIISYHRGSILQEYFEKLSKKQLKVVHKPQYIDRLDRVVSGKVKDLLSRIDERKKLVYVSKQLNLGNLWDRSVDVLSGGERQLVAIAASLCREGDVYLFDEPSSYLDVRERLKVAREIRTLAKDGKIVFVAEHDLAILDYLSDQICVLYGEPGVYGIISKPHGVRVGINIYLEGYLPDDNVRFRSEPIVFHATPSIPRMKSQKVFSKWGSMEKRFKGFSLKVSPGEVHEGEIVGVLGPNGIGKTTFIRLLAGVEKPDEGVSPVWEGLTISYKPQYLVAEQPITVERILRESAGEDFGSSQYNTEIVQPLRLNRLFDRTITELSGGELQKTMVAVCLSMKAQIYLIDEGSAYLDVEERLLMAKVVQRIVENRCAVAFLVEHDVIVADYTSDRVMVFSGEPGLEGHATSPMDLRDGMNAFLEELGVTFRRDPHNGRPRVNKSGSKLDTLQKSLGEYYYVSREEGE
jgi:ATP-binding cassette, sub-family E, member 1